MPPKAADITKAGISTSQTGDRVIASSVRADGSVRKEIKVRPGYKPPEDVEVYKSQRAEAFRRNATGGIPGVVPGLGSSDSKSDASSANNKNAKRKEARKRAAAAKEDGAVQDNGQAVEPAAQPEEEDPEVKKQKEARKLSKKLKQARELKDKKDKGEGLLPEQFEKVIKINELIRQLETLGFDVEGNKKEQDEVEATSEERKSIAP